MKIAIILIITVIMCSSCEYSPVTNVNVVDSTRIHVDATDRILSGGNSTVVMSEDEDTTKTQTVDGHYNGEASGIFAIGQKALAWIMDVIFPSK